MNTCSRPEFERICPKQFNPSATCDLCTAWDKKERFEYVWLGGWATACMRKVVTGMRNREVNWWLNVLEFLGTLFGFVGTLFTLFSLAIEASGSRSTFVDGEEVTYALIISNHPTLFKWGIGLVCGGFFLMLISNAFKLCAKKE